MINKIILTVILAITFASCQHIHTDHDENHDHEHEDVKQLITRYTEDIELFAEADPFIIGETSNIIAHFSYLSDFSPIQDAEITLSLTVDNKQILQQTKKASKEGIYIFNITPKKNGKGTLFFKAETKKKIFSIEVQNIEIYEDEHVAMHETEEQNELLTSINVYPFTKEQSWKIDFATGYPKKEMFGEVIKTAAKVNSAQSDEILISAKTPGIAVFSDESILEGKTVKKGQNLFFLSGSSVVDDNTSVKFAEAKNNYIKAEADYKMVLELAKDKIVSQKRLNEVKNEYENAKFLYDNFKKNFSSSGQNVRSPMNGFIKHIYIQNGEFAEAGQSVISITKNKTLLLVADVQQKYAVQLPNIFSANIKTLHNNKTYSFEELNGKFLSYGKHTNDDNYLLSVSLQIDNTIDLVSGGFVELFLKTSSKEKVLTIPNEALIEDQGVFYVYVQITPEQFEKREVQTGSTDGIRTRIISGIDETERIVSKGAVYIKLSEATGGLDAHSGHVH